MKHFFLFNLCTFLLFSNNLNYGVLNNQAFVLNKRNLDLKLAYLRVNDDLDFLNMRESELGSLSQFGTSIGNMSGYEFGIRHGLLKNDSIFFNFQEWNIDYAGSTLTNRKIEFFNRFNIVANKYAYINSFSFDIGIIKDSADRVEITNIPFMNSMIKKVAPNNTYSLSENDKLFDKQTQNFINPSVAIDNLSANTLYLKLLFGKKISHRTVINLYSNYSYIDLTSKIDISPIILRDYLNNIKIPNLNRQEQVLDIGFSIISDLKYFIFELDYKYSKIFRDSHLDYRNYNHDLEIALSKAVTREILVFISGKMMFQQLNREIPYLYNRYTETQFDKKYGFAKFGLIYKF